MLLHFVENVAVKPTTMSRIEINSQNNRAQRIQNDADYENEDDGEKKEARHRRINMVIPANLNGSGVVCAAF